MIQQLPCEIIDSICQYITLHEISNLSLVNKYFHQIVQQNHFYSTCRKLFTNKGETYIIIEYPAFGRKHYFFCREHDDWTPIILNKLKPLKFFRELTSNCETYSYGSGVCYWSSNWNNLSDEDKSLIEHCPPIDNKFRIRIDDQSDNLRLIRLIKEKCQKVNILAKKNKVFKFACGKNYPEVAKHLLETCAEVNALPNNKTIFREAFKNKCLSYTKLSIDVNQ